MRSPVRKKGYDAVGTDLLESAQVDDFKESNNGGNIFVKLLNINLTI